MKSNENINSHLGNLKFIKLKETFYETDNSLTNY